MYGSGKIREKDGVLLYTSFGSDDGDELVDEDEDENVEFDDSFVEADYEENIAEDFEEEKKGLRIKEKNGVF